MKHSILTAALMLGLAARAQAQDSVDVQEPADETALVGGAAAPSAEVAPEESEPAARAEGPVPQADGPADEEWAPLDATPDAAASDSSAEGLRLEFNGWFDALLRADTRPGASPYVDVHNLYLIPQVVFSPEWRLFLEFEFEHLTSLPDGGGELKIERAYLEWQFVHDHRLRVGKFNTPMGLRIPTHWWILTVMLRKTIPEDNEYVPVKNVGLLYEGSLVLAKSMDLFVSYSVYGGNGSEISGTDAPIDGLQGYGADLSLNVGPEYRLGGSFYRQRRLVDPATDLFRTEQSVGAYVSVDLPFNILLRCEYFQQWRDGVPAVRAAYALIRYSIHGFEELSFAYRFELGDDERRALGGTHRVHVANVSWQARPFLRIVAEVELSDFDTTGPRDYQLFTFWIGVNF